MSVFGRKKREKVLNDKVDAINKKHRDETLTSNLDDNIKLISALFKDNDMIRFRKIRNSRIDLGVCLVNFEGLKNEEIIDSHIVKPFMIAETIDKKNNVPEALINEIIQVNEIKISNSIQDIIRSVTYGDTIMLVENENHALIINSKSFTIRSITEPMSEQVMSGPREGFTEPLVVNLSLLLRRLRTNDLKMRNFSIGKRTNTQVCVCYIEGIANENILKELYRRLEVINIDGIIDANYINEQIRDSKLSLFSTIGRSERPDSVAAKLLEGRIAVFVDGSPVVLTLPYLFIENFQSAEDYYLNYYYASFYRFLRVIAFFISIIIPGFYISIVAFHREMLPTPLLISVALERQSVPFPAVIEVFLMLIVFEIIKETGIRMPSNIGQALSIVGALVIGQSAVEAKLVAAPVIIVIALTAITSLLVTRLSAAAIILRFLLLFLSSILGLYGLIIGLAAVLVHLFSLTSFSVRYVTPFDTPNFQVHKDILIRAPWWKMKTRPEEISRNRVRLVYNAEEDDN